MHKRINEKIKDFFINLGKQHRFMLPVAVVGLFVTMFVMRVADYLKRGTRRFACVLFVLFISLFSNSFAFAYFNNGNGFLNTKEESVILADIDHTMVLKENNESTIMSDNVVDPFDSEYGDVEGQDTVSLEEILDVREHNETFQEEKNEEEELSFKSDDWNLVLINKQHPISTDYEFTLGNLSNSMQCDNRIIDDLLSMMKAADQDGIKLVVCSPYRDLEKQKKLFERKIRYYIKSGYSYIDAYKLSSQVVTIPGASEHQVGLAIDLISPKYTMLDEGFENTDAGRWLKKHCHEFGFILRYPKGKENITSIEYEPWHFRYVGRDAATIIMDNEICLEEFWDLYM